MSANPLDRAYWLEDAGYRHSAFVSWPHKGSRTAKRLVEKLSHAIESDAKASGLPASVFVDRNIEHGRDWHRQITTAICQSITFIAVCEPEYYNSTFCGREWAGMDTLATQRLGDGKMAILPLVWHPARGETAKDLFQVEHLPEQVARLQYYDFTKIRLRRSNPEESDEFDDMVIDLLGRIDKTATALLVKNSRAGDCPHFELPEESAFQQFRQAAQQYPLTRKQ